MMANIKISIIVPCYNVEKFLPNLIDSISNQSNSNIEYIFINDGSSDSTSEILEQFCRNKNWCKLISQTNQGVSAARNSALDVAKGEYVYLLDGDDNLREEAINNMLEAIDDNYPDIIFSPVVAVKRCGTIHMTLPFKSGDYTPEEIFNQCTIFPTDAKLLYRRSLIKANNLRFNRQLFLGEVYDFTLRFMSLCKTVRVISQSLFTYNINESSATRAVNYDKDSTIVKTIESYYNHGKRFLKFESFHNTACKLAIFFSYNKYIKSGICDPAAVEVIRSILTNSIITQCLRKVAFSNKSNRRDRNLALYIFLTKVWGFRLLCKIIKFKQRR